jgi:hypothetical protein
VDADLDVKAFSSAFIEQTFVEPPEKHPAVGYLERYLVHLRASAVLVERHYVDRHFLDDFQEYYARSFLAPKPSCRRMHFFADLSEAELEAWLERGYSSLEGREEAEKALPAKYLGFVIRRPIAHATIGRTVLKTYEVEGRRNYKVVRPYHVNVAGLRLETEGLAYQQQDGGAAVCASTALWSALQRVAHVAGHRTPTPSAITRAAQSPFPASQGLTDPQMAAALSSLGYVADLFAPSTNRAAFRAKVVSCLDSHLPVILLIFQKRETGAGPDAGFVQPGHAVAVTGYSEPPSVVEVAPSVKGRPSARMKSASVSLIYVHDDNVGWHAHYELLDSDERNDAGQKLLTLRRGRTDQPPHDDWTVYGALVPKPAKLRMSVEDVFAAIWGVRPLAERIFPGLTLHYAARFDSGVAYKRALFERRLEFSQMRDFQRLTSFPRHIGVVSVFDDVELLCEVVLDVSEVHRRPLSPPILAFVAPGVAYGSRAWVEGLVPIAAHFKVPHITAPITAAAAPAKAATASPDPVGEAPPAPPAT